jgi:SPP1 family predicted phage head-tail adaptor
MRAGALRKRITIQVRSPGVDDYGGQQNNWQDVATVWGEITPGGGHKGEIGGGVRDVTNHLITLRYSKGLTAKNRIKYSDSRLGLDRYFSIVTVNNMEERNKEMQLTVVEGTTGG